jgi:DNA-binding GntR family transcriptional regulator
LIVVSDAPPFEPDTEGPEYIYVQLANHIQALIEAGELRPGARLPAERTMAEEYGVAYLTVRRAMQELRERHLIQTVIGRGTFVARRDEEIKD